MTNVLGTAYSLIEVAIAFSVVVLFGFSFLCMFFFLTTEEGEARGLKRKDLSWWTYRLGRGFLMLYCIIGALGIIRAVVVGVGLSFFGVAILVTIAALVAYTIRMFRR